MIICCLSNPLSVNIEMDMPRCGCNSQAGDSYVYSEPAASARKASIWHKEALNVVDIITCELPQIILL